MMSILCVCEADFKSRQQLDLEELNYSSRINKKSTSWTRAETAKLDTK